MTREGGGGGGVVRGHNNIHSFTNIRLANLSKCYLEHCQIQRQRDFKSETRSTVSTILHKSLHISWNCTTSNPSTSP